MDRHYSSEIDKVLAKILTVVSGVQEQVEGETSAIQALTAAVCTCCLFFIHDTWINAHFCYCLMLADLVWSSIFNTAAIIHKSQQHLVLITFFLTNPYEVAEMCNPQLLTTTLDLYQTSPTHSDPSTHLSQEIKLYTEMHKDAAGGKKAMDLLAVFK